MAFFHNFIKIFISILQIFLVVLVGFWFSRKKLLDEKAVYGLTALTINLFLPCLIFAKLINGFKGSLPDNWFVYPFLGMGVCFVGFIVASIIVGLDKGMHGQLEFKSLISFQNCGYLPLILVLSLFDKEVSTSLFIMIFLFLPGFNLIFWGYGVQLLDRNSTGKFDIRKAVNPPMLALIISVALVLAGVANRMPQSMLRMIELVGNCTLPIALISLGAILSGCLFKPRKAARNFLIKAVVAKLVIMPIIALVCLYVFKEAIPPLMGLVILIEMSMPSAITLSLVTYYQNAQCGIISQAVLLCHVFCVLSIPFFLSIYLALIKI